MESQPSGWFPPQSAGDTSMTGTSGSSPVVQVSKWSRTEQGRAVSPSGAAPALAVIRDASLPHRETRARGSASVRSDSTTSTAVILAVELQMAQAEQQAQADQAEYLRSQHAMLAEQERVAREVHAASTEAHRSEMAVLRAQLELQRAVARSTRGSRASSVAAPEPAQG